ncbi:unnamed protein product [Bemisia tabaci]|uniref:ribose-5-phosphate isomerase n=1 Tax=Bemisia tabaci TaxID=7038 RepID=A0A9N9ZY55_BEMTA|nr:PREDICTED: ribose-5-phosphate isomerase [Bemisia tabaci]CAH0381724.1 unnamed protein product [Bemisia tabaci]
MSIEEAKRLAAFKAVDTFIQDNTIIGVGSGSTIVYAVERLAELKRTKNLNVVCVPTSFQARQLILSNDLKLGDLEQYPKLNCTIDGADEVDKNLVLIKGGGGCLLQEKIIAGYSEKLIIVADYNKDSQHLGDNYKKGIPIEVLPLAYKPIQMRIQEKYRGSATLRMSKMKAGPVITDNGNLILDWVFPTSETFNWDEVNKTIKMMPGVIETGLFINMAHAVFFGTKDGSVKEIYTK